MSPAAPFVCVWLRRAWRLHDNPVLWEGWKRAGSASQRLHAFRTVTHGTSCGVAGGTQRFYLGGARRAEFVEACVDAFAVSLAAACGETALTTYHVGQGGDVRDVAGLFAKLQHAAAARPLVILVERVYTPLDLAEEACLLRCAAAARVDVVSINCFNLCPDFAALCTSPNLHANPLAYNPFVRALEAAGVAGPAATFPDAVQQMRRAYTSAAGGEPSRERALRIPPSEAAALARLDAKLSDAQWATTFSKPLTCAMALAPSTTCLSPYLATGVLSPRLFHARVTALEAAAKAAGQETTAPPQSLAGQLYWREFSHYLGYLVGAGFDGTDGVNHPCLLANYAWEAIGTEEEDAAHAADEGEGLRSVDPADLFAADAATKYRTLLAGRTGYPAVDAGVAQLKGEGWLHHIHRHLLACFFTRGGLNLDWRLGQRVFERYLLDYDWAINAGQWQWLSCSFLFFQFNRVYRPFGFAAKHDPDGSYRRRWLADDAPPADRALLERRFDANAASLQDGMQRAYLAAPPGFLRLVQPNVLGEWQREDAAFAAALKAAVRAAKAAPLEAPCDGPALRLPPVVTPAGASGREAMNGPAEAAAPPRLAPPRAAKKFKKRVQ
eukprot:TRINITY_DN25456_c0_g1_i1.p1 TRINITY_DN25456_c0_g1~~TRINITY_DN25456_c0_g1_i1.p1  ORF type:complete len:611 (+),score=172.06 TRINITY_DN25456_c0_g1_i1:33-1865(+)